MPCLDDVEKSRALFIDAVNRQRRTLGKSNRDLEEHSGVSEKNISKFFCDSLKNPNFYNVVAICKSLGVSIDEIFMPELHQKEQPTAQTAEKDLRHKDEMIEMMKEQIKQRRKLTNILVAVIFVLLALMILYLVLIDAQNLNYGLIRG